MFIFLLLANSIMQKLKLIISVLVLMCVGFALSADFTYQPTGIPYEFEFTTYVSDDAVSISWIVDGIEVSPVYVGNITLVHDFDLPGTYNVTLIVENMTHAINVSKPVEAQPLELNTTLIPRCDVDADRFGFVKLEAYAAYQNNGWYCHDVNVSVEIGDNVYTTRKHVNCFFSTYVQLPVGTHDVKFMAQYPGYNPKNALCRIEVTQSPELVLVIKSPKNGSTYETDDSILVEAVGMIIGRNVEGDDVSAYLYSGNNLINSIDMSYKYPGEYVGNMKINASDGIYDLTVTMVYGEYVKSKSIKVIVNNTADGVIPPGGARINILYPSQNQVFAINSTVPLEIEFLNYNMQMIKDAEVTATISRNGEEIDEISMTEKQYTYWLSYKFESAGNYVVVFHGVKDDLEDEKRLYLSIGLPGEIAQALNFTVQILIPRSDTYAEESQIIARARVRMEGQPVVDADVILQLGDNEYEMEYYQFGEYTYVIGPLGIGMYEMRVIASYTNLIAEDSVIFFISEHALSVDLIEPEDGQEVYLTLRDQMPLKVDVRDERGDIVPRALVLVDIIDPAGVTTETQLFQDPDTGIYKSVFYPDQEGIYRMTTTSSKAGYVGKIIDSNFKVTLKEDGFFPLKISWETLLTLIIAVAIAILVIGILRMMI